MDEVSKNVKKMDEVTDFLKEHGKNDKIDLDLIEQRNQCEEIEITQSLLESMSDPTNLNTQQCIDRVKTETGLCEERIKIIYEELEGSFIAETKKTSLSTMLETINSKYVTTKQEEVRQDVK